MWLLKNKIEADKARQKKKPQAPQTSSSWDPSARRPTADLWRAGHHGNEGCRRDKELAVYHFKGWKQK